jgi:hypothetical protein
LARRAHHDVGGDDTVGGPNARHLPAVVDDAENFGVWSKRCAARDGHLRLRLDGPQRLHQTIGWGVESAENAIGIQQRMHLCTLSRGQQFASDPPRLGPAGLAVQVRPTLRSRGDLETAGRVEGPAIGMT